jgi:hypothetical protein
MGMEEGSVELTEGRRVLGCKAARLTVQTQP